MIGRGHAKITLGSSSLLGWTLALAAGLVAAPARSAINQETASRNTPVLSATTINPTAHAAEKRANLRFAETYKYEIPKALRAPQSTPQSSPPIVQKSSPPAVQSAPLSGGGGTINRGRYRQSTPRVRSGGSYGSCELCRNTCYVSYRVNSYSSQFIPCMRACWNRLCRR